MRNLKLSIFLLLFPAILFTQTEWIQQHSGTNVELRVIFMVNENTGFVAGNNLLLKTTNGGINWVQNSICSNDIINSISFINEHTGIVAIGNLSNPNSIGIIANTTNSGTSWNCVNSGNPMFDLFLFNGNICYGLYSQWSPPFNSFAPVAKKSSNSGQNWNTMSSIRGFDLFFLNANTGFFVGQNQLVYKTTNSGNTWNSYQISTVNEPYVDLLFVNDMTGYVDPNHYQHLYIMKTTNGGVNWVQMNTGLTFPLISLFFVNELTGFSTSYNSRIVKTTNGGISWITQNYVNNSPDLFEIRMVNLNTGFAIGGQGLILKTTNAGGSLSITPLSTEIPADYSLAQNYPNPFNPQTNVRFEIPESALVILKVYNSLGEEITTLANEELRAGIYEVNFDAKNLPSGMYYYRITAGSYTQTKKMVLVK